MRRAIARGRRGVVAQSQHHQRIAQAGEAEPDASLVGRLALLLGQRPHGDVEHVVEHAHRHLHQPGQAGVVEAGVGLEGVEHQAGEVDRPQAAAAVGRQRLLATRVARGDVLAVGEVVVGVDAVEEQDARLGVVVGRSHDLVPQRTRRQLAVDPGPVAAGLAALVGASLLLGRTGLGAVHQFHVSIGSYRLHEGVGDTHREVEVLQIAAVLGVDELLDVRVVAAQHAHLGAAARAGALHGFAGAIEDAHVADRPRGMAAGAAHPGTARPDARKVVAHAPAAPHGLGGFGERDVDAGVTFIVLRDRVAHRLHETVDQRRGQTGARRRLDASRRHEPIAQRLGEALLPDLAMLRRFRLGQRTCHTRVHGVGGSLVALGVLLEQHLGADRLRWQVANRGAGRGSAGAGRVHGSLSWRPPL